MPEPGIIYKEKMSLEKRELFLKLMFGNTRGNFFTFNLFREIEKYI